MMASPFAFVDVVVRDRDLVITSAYDHACRLEPRASELAWFCDLDDGTPTGESDPASFVRWACPALGTGTGTRASGPELPPIDVRRAGPRSDLGKLLKKFSFLSSRPPAAGVEGRYVYTDPAGVLDAELRRRIENWPPALHGDGVVRPAELGSITRTREGLIVGSGSWWGSSPVLDHQIGLAIDIARRLIG